MSTCKGDVVPGFPSGPDELSSEVVVGNSRSSNNMLSSWSSSSFYPHQTSAYESTDDNNGDLLFCTGENVEDCVAYLNQELMLVGLPSLCNKATLDKGSFEVSHLLNATYLLLQRLHRCIKSRDDLQDSKSRVDCDLDRQHVEKGRLLSQVEQLKRELSQAHLAEELQVKMNRSVNNKLKLEKEETKRLQAIVQSRDAQYKHGIKKKEMELVKLKDRLHSLLVDKTEQKIGIEMSEILLRSDGKRGRWQSNSTSNVEEELYRNIISGYEEKQKLLMVENHEMRQALSNLQKDLHQLLCITSAHDRKLPDQTQMKEPVLKLNNSGTSCGDPDSSQSNELSGVFTMPLSIVHEDLISDIQQNIFALKNYIQTRIIAGCHERVESSERLKKSKENYDVTRLQRKLEQYRNIIEQNLTFHGESASHTMESVDEVSFDDNLTEQREQLTQEKMRFYEQQVAFEEKKRALADVEFHLNSERIALEMAKFNLTPGSRKTKDMADVQRPQSALATSLSGRQRLDTKRALPSTPLVKNVARNSSSAELMSDRVNVDSNVQASDASQWMGLGQAKQKNNTSISTPASAKPRKLLSGIVLRQSSEFRGFLD